MVPLGRQGALVVAAVAILSLQNVVCSSYYDDMMLSDLYQRLAELDPDYLESIVDPAELADPAELGYPAELEDPTDLEGPLPDTSNIIDDSHIALDSRDSGQASIRDSEYMEGNSNDGFQYISGGAGEGQQHLTPEGNQSNVQEVKSDDALPFYCHPPNPCPKGYNAKEHGCQEDVEDTAEAEKEWINGMMSHGLCACDEEHMFNCPQYSDTINSQKAQGDRDALDAVLNKLLGDNNKGNNPYSTGSKRESLVAKKSPGMFKRSVRAAAEDMDHSEQVAPKANPYLQGTHIRTVAKKGIGYQKI